jgi:hypothetical protein
VIIWFRSALPVACAALLLLATAGPSVNAQSENSGLYAIINAMPAQRSGPRILSVPRERARAPVRRALEPGMVPLAASPVEALPKVDPTTFVVVLGDTLGELLAGGLDEALGDVPTAAVIRKTRADSGLVRSDFHDWPKVVREILASDQRITVGVMLLGANDRQAIREGDITHEPLSERWRELYRDRVDAVVQAFAERRVPLIWVGAPPMQNGRLSTDLVTLNEIYRQRSERAGAVYVDLWQGFVDAENRYSASGPDLSGQIARLRTSDGVHFTRAGARKAAHFADVALRRLLPDVSGGPVLASPFPGPSPQGVPLQPGIEAAPLPPELQPGGIERMIDQIARLSNGLEPIRLPEIKVKPVAGPVLPLTGPAVAQGGTLVSTLGAARGTGPDASVLNRVFEDGKAPAPAAGRADDFRWPKAP